MWHWPICEVWIYVFIWGYYHLNLVDDRLTSRLLHFSLFYTALTRPSKGKTAVHGCNFWPSVWTLSRDSIMSLLSFLGSNEPCITVTFLFWRCIIFNNYKNSFGTFALSLLTSFTAVIIVSQWVALVWRKTDFGQSIRPAATVGLARNQIDEIIYGLRL